MATGGVEHAAFGDVLAPSNRVVVAVLAALIGLFVEEDEDHIVGLQVPEAIPLVLALPFVREVLGGGVILDDRPQGGGLDLRMAGEIAADHLAVPRPLIFGVGSGMDTDERATVFEPGLESRATGFSGLRRGVLGFLGGVLRDDVAHDIAGGAHEGDRAILREVLGGEDRGVLGDVDLEAGGLKLFREQLVAERDGILVPEAGGLREDQGAVRFGSECDHRGKEEGEEGAHGCNLG